MTWIVCVTRLQPDIIITWGPDGGSNHMDHRLVGASITQVYLSKNWEKTRALYYVGTPSSKLDNADSKLLEGIADDYLTKQIKYSKEDAEKSIKAFECYKTQYSRETMEEVAKHMRSAEQTIFFRPLIKATTVSDDLFVLPD